MTFTGRYLRRHRGPAVEGASLITDVGQQLDFAVRLLAAAVLGGVIGIEREIHDHPAGIRTHMLVSLGSAVFTILGIVAFQGTQPDGTRTPVDPTRIASQVVNGIGFLGAGAILKYGTTVRGLTTAASLWATAAIGMSAAAGAWLVSIVGTGIMLASLWPLHWLVMRLRPADARALHFRLAMQSVASLGPVMAEVHERRAEISSMETEMIGEQYEVNMHIVLPTGTVRAEVIDAMRRLRGIEVMSAE